MQCNFTGWPVFEGWAGPEVQPHTQSFLLLTFIMLLFFFWDCFEWNAELAQIQDD